MGANVDAMVEQAAADKGLDAPRVKPSELDGLIKVERYWQPPGTTMTVCCLTLVNGFSVIGSSAAASPENFDAELGRKIAHAEARDKIWELEGYLLRQRLYAAEMSGTPFTETQEP